MMSDDGASRPISTYVAQSEQTVVRLMRHVALAMLPGIILTLVFFGIGVIVQLVIATVTVALLEILVSHLRGMRAYSGLTDGSWLVLAMIVAVSVPSYCPWTITLTAAIVASLVGKHLFGGTGQNLFNPAMVGIVFVLVCFPNISTFWPGGIADTSISFEQGLSLIFGSANDAVDALTGATLLEYERTQIALAVMRSEFGDADFYGIFAEKSWEWVNLAYLIGGIYLCVRRVIRATIPIWFLGSLLIITSLAHGFDGGRYAGPFVHCFAGATMLCAFFIATDPVSSPGGQRAAAIYAVLLALLVFMLRNYGAYPDGVAFAVILLNALVPMLDRLFSPQIYGHKPTS